MRVKTFYAWSEKGMDRKVNEFLEGAAAEVVDIKFATPIFFFSAMVMYKPSDSSKNISF
ncbi:sporulation protein Cse60 [Planococcus salinus]|uniref:Sporulation protein Cse60 n=1 Tax=Planococcus salinus TaxID=1848460 RepID=A0A3M8P5H0_9BACL|nr:sporulation protein Cse60 [Planococcus salinus]RNF38852.1 sporulation protein Cse60 [Planococcus salinus]